MPDPLGKEVTTTMTMDAKLNPYLATGKSLTGCLHFINKTPVDWYSKKQATVETATYGSEFIAAKTATERIMDIRQTLYMCALHGMHTQASQPPYIYVVHQELLMDVPFAQAKQYISKLSTSHLSTLNMDFSNWNVLKRILIAMLNENKADCNENFRICAEEAVAPLYKQ